MSYWDSSALAKLYLKESNSAVFLSLAKRAVPISIRTLDALHLAAALSVGETEFISNDIRQRSAAQALGLTVLP